MKTLLLSLILLFSFLSHAQETTTFILVRHAEKADDGTRNPPLSDEGIERAEVLLELLSSADITAIYSTDYKRTQMTVTPLAAEKGLEIMSYDWTDPKALMAELLEKNQGGTVVISGHSNTTPVLANILLGEEKFPQFDDSDYGNLLIVTVSEIGNGKVTHLRF